LYLFYLADEILLNIFKGNIRTLINAIKFKDPHKLVLSTKN